MRDQPYRDMVSGKATRAARLLYTRLGGTPRVSEIYSLDPWKAVERLTRVPLRYEVRFCRAPEDAAKGWLESTLSMCGEGGPKRTPLPRFQRKVCIEDAASTAARLVVVFGGARKVSEAKLATAIAVRQSVKGLIDTTLWS